jgi:hypothetical protein
LRKSWGWNLPTCSEAGIDDDKQTNKQPKLCPPIRRKKWYFFFAITHNDDCKLMLYAGYRHPEAPRKKGCQDSSRVRRPIPPPPRQGKQIALLVYIISTQAYSYCSCTVSWPAAQTQALTKSFSSGSSCPKSTVLPSPSPPSSNRFLHLPPTRARSSSPLALSPTTSASLLFRNSPSPPSNSLAVQRRGL